MSNYLVHYGRKGMKWGKNIFGVDENYAKKSRDLARAQASRFTEFVTEEDVADEYIPRLERDRRQQFQDVATVARGALGNKSAQQNVLQKHNLLERERKAYKRRYELEQIVKRNKEQKNKQREKRAKRLSKMSTSSITSTKEYAIGRNLIKGISSVKK